MHPLDGIGIHIRGRHFHGGGEVQNHLPVGRRLPHVGHRIADLEGEFQFGAGVGLGGVLEVNLGLALHLVREFLAQLSSVDRNIGDASLVETEDHATLKGRRRVVEMNDRLLGAADRFERALDQRLPGLREHLNDHVVRDEVLLDDLSHEIEIGLRGRREADFDLLVAHIDKKLKHAQLPLRRHGVDECLIAVSKVDRAPARSLGDDGVGPGAIGQIDGGEGLVAAVRHGRRLLSVGLLVFVC